MGKEDKSNFMSTLAERFGKKDNVAKQFESELGDITDDGRRVHTIFGGKFAFLYSLIMALRAVIEFVAGTVVFIVLLSITQHRLLAVPYVAALLGGVMLIFAAVFGLLSSPFIASKIFISDEAKRYANMFGFAVVFWALLVPGFALMFGSEIYTAFWIMDYFYYTAPDQINRAVFGGFCGLLVLVWFIFNLVGVILGCCNAKYAHSLQRLRRHKQEKKGMALLLDKIGKTVSAVLSVFWPPIVGLLSLALAIAATVGLVTGLQDQDWLLANRDVTVANIVIGYVWELIACAFLLGSAIFGVLSGPATGGLLSLKPRLVLAVIYVILLFIGNTMTMLTEIILVGVALFYGFQIADRTMMYYIIPATVALIIVHGTIFALGIANIAYLKRRIKDLGGDGDASADSELKGRA